MWQAIGRIAVRLAIYAVGHPDQVKALVDDAKKVKAVATGK